jgi:hypothetical protein
MVGKTSKPHLYRLTLVIYNGELKSNIPTTGEAGLVTSVIATGAVVEGAS